MAMKLVLPTSGPERRTKTTLEAAELTVKYVGTWQRAPFQRQVKVNRKVTSLVERLKTDNVLPGVITIGVVDGIIYVIDGQHRLHAFLESGLPVCYADVRTLFCESMKDLAIEYVELNQHLQSMKTDDLLHGLEVNNPTLQRIHKRCPFIGYTNVRRSSSSPIVAMASVLRAWAGSGPDVPILTIPATTAAGMLADDESAIDFLLLCYAAFQRDKEYAPLWNSLHVMLAAWLYRRVVLGEGLDAYSRATRYTPADFRSGLSALASDASFVAFLRGKTVDKLHRAPVYNRMKKILARQYHADHGKKASLPRPAWAH